MQNKKIVLLATSCDSTNYIYNAITKKYIIEKVIIENKESKKIFLQRRIKKLGILKVIGQLFFMVGISKIISFFSKQRIDEIIKEKSLDDSEIATDKILPIESINNDACVQYLQSTKPDLIIVNGTRIISKKILQSVDCNFINMHAGITPKYRGVHGMYWALANNDAQNAGVTIHYVDAGIDTGNIIDQQFCTATKNDNFCTYPYLQFGAGIPSLINAIDAYFANEIVVKQSLSESNLYYHPTIIEYLSKRIFKGIK